MIIEYHRPQKLAEALTLLARKSPKTKVLAGGTEISHLSSEKFAVVDLQSLGLNKITKTDQKIGIGATVTLQQLVDEKAVPLKIREAAQLEYSQNLRNMGTVGGDLVTADARSMLLASFLCLDARLIFEPGNRKLSIEEWLDSRKGIQPGSLITKIEFDDKPFTFTAVRKSPKDSPIVSIFGCVQKNGKLRIAVGGNGKYPFLLDESSDIKKGLLAGYTKYSFNNVNLEYFHYVVPELIIRVKEVLK